MPLTDEQDEMELRMTTRRTHWTENAVFLKLKGLFPAPAYTVIPQVRNGTGFSRGTVRTSDAIVVSNWPSRGLYLHGIEIKVSRSDWNTELRNPQKAEDIAQYCKYWSVAAPADIILPAEVPELWGLIEVDGRGASTVKAPVASVVTPPDLAFLAAILRAADKVYVSTAERDEAVEKERAGMDEERATAAKYRPLEYEHNKLKEAVEAFQTASGVDISHAWDAGKIGEAVRLLRDGRLDGHLQWFRRCKDEADRMSQGIAQLLAEISTNKD